jgi:hypothetical protein
MDQDGADHGPEIRREGRLRKGGAGLSACQGLVAMNGMMFWLQNLIWNEFPRMVSRSGKASFPTAGVA